MFRFLTSLLKHIHLVFLATLSTATICLPAQEVRADDLPPAAKRSVDFAKDVRPLLEKACFECHAGTKAKGELQLDTREHALKGGESGPVLIPGKSADSLLIQAVAGVKPDLLMPKKGERLNAEQIGILRAWIDRGAEWPAVAAGTNPDKRNHWAFKPPVRPKIPAAGKNWARNPIDRFVFARLEKEKLRPSPVAEKRTLLRRLTLDLTGLPPTIEEIQNFLSDRQPGAYERVVERLLASPHYGERWGRQWLDVARYADTNGYEKDKPRSIWPYRDWVIKAFNEDMPYDEFVIEQLAGDLLPGNALDHQVATGFLRNSMLNQEGGIEPEQFRVEALIDRVDTVGKAFLGLTVNCCQCHNHKYDPFSQKEYYQLYAFLNQDDEAFCEVPTSEQLKQREQLLTKVHELEVKSMSESTNLPERMAAWEKEMAHQGNNWTILEPKDWQNFATKFEKQEDGSLLGGGDLQPGGTMRVWAETQATNITGLRLEALTNANLIYGGPGLVGKGSFIVKEFTVEAWALNNPTVTNSIKFRRAIADASAPGFNVTNAIDGNTNSGWVPCATPDHRNESHCAVFECAEPFGFPGGTRMEITIHQLFDREKDAPRDKLSKLDCHMLGCLRLSTTTDDGPLNVDGLNERVRQALALAPGERSLEQRRVLFEQFASYDGGFTNLNKEVTAEFEKWPYPPTTLVLKQRPQPRLTHMFKRGDRLRPGDEVQPDVLSVLNPFPAEAPKNRLGLAKWLVAPQSPTTARVLVNRMWQSYFGQGLVTTPEDFGTRVEEPSHPELLDWLACELMQPTAIAAESPTPWSIKHIHRLIVNSATYRQSSRVSPELLAKDQYNRLLARGPRFRVEAEVVQDIALSASGLLNLKVGGPSVYPPIPASVGDTVYGGFSWNETKGDDRYRRGLYTFWKRSLPFPSLIAFDMPPGENSCTRRVRSNTPLQALTTLNEKTFVESAQAMALKIMKKEGLDDRSRAAYAFELCTGRKPDNVEVEKLLKFWREEYNMFENNTAAAVNVSVTDLKNLPPDLNLHKAAAWAMVSRAILNLDETITKE